MVLSRAVNTTGPGADGILGTADDDLNAHTNTTTPFVDQNQTYTSHPSHQVFLREYIMVGGKPLATGHLLNGAHGEGNWGEVKAQAHNLLGINLTDADVFNVPLLATDRYGAFIRGPNGREATHVEPPVKRIRGVGRQVRGVRVRGALIRLREHDRLVQPLDLPAALDEIARQPVQQFGVRRHFTEFAEVK